MLSLRSSQISQVPCQAGTIPHGARAHNGEACRNRMGERTVIIPLHILVAEDNENICHDDEPVDTAVAPRESRTSLQSAAGVPPVAAKLTVPILRHPGRGATDPCAISATIIVGSLTPKPGQMQAEPKVRVAEIAQMSVSCASVRHADALSLLAVQVARDPYAHFASRYRRLLDGNFVAVVPGFGLGPFGLCQYRNTPPHVAMRILQLPGHLFINISRGLSHGPKMRPAPCASPRLSLPCP